MLYRIWAIEEYMPIFVEKDMILMTKELSGCGGLWGLNPFSLRKT